VIRGLIGFGKHLQKTMLVLTYLKTKMVKTVNGKVHYYTEGTGISTGKGTCLWQWRRTVFLKTG
jgi:hypothetical protein